VRARAAAFLAFFEQISCMIKDVALNRFALIL
jgi:hypothetical protein